MVKNLTLATLASTVIILLGCDDPSKGKDSEVDRQTGNLKQESKIIHHKSKKERVQKFYDLKDEDSSGAQEIIVSEMKQNLPLFIDENTLMVDVSIDDNVFSYKFVIKRTPLAMINSRFWQEALQENIRSNYCIDDSNVQMFRGVFSGGAVYNYYLSDRLVYRYKIIPSDCD